MSKIFTYLVSLLLLAGLTINDGNANPCNSTTPLYQISLSSSPIKVDVNSTFEYSHFSKEAAPFVSTINICLNYLSEVSSQNANLIIYIQNHGYSSFKSSLKNSIFLHQIITSKHQKTT